jgi:hypothetical protein
VPALTWRHSVVEDCRVISNTSLCLRIEIEDCIWNYLVSVKFKVILLISANKVTDK